MTKRACTRTSNISVRLLAMRSVVLAFFLFCVDAEALLINFISISTSCAPNVNQGVSGPTGPLVNSNSFSQSCVDFFGPNSGSGAASSSVDYGVMKIYAEGTASGFSGYGSATVTLESRDLLTFGTLDPALIGQLATVDAAIQLQALLTGSGQWTLTIQGATPDTVSIFDFDCSAPCVFGFSFPVVIGRPRLLDIQLVGSAAAATLGQPGVFFSSIDMSQSVYWDGIQSVTFDGQPVAFTLTSASGHDWTLSSVPGNGSAPEPASLALLALGLAGLGFARRQSIRANQPLKTASRCRRTHSS